MLQVTGSIRVARCSLEIDQYVPVSFRCDDAFSLPSLWWRTGDLRTSFLEIGISQSTGAVYAVTAVSLPEVSSRRSSFGDLIAEPAELISGLPLVKIEPIDTTQYFDEKRELICDFEGESLYIWFGELVVVPKFYKVDRMFFGVNSNNEICVVRVDRLSQEEISNIASSSEQ